MEDHLRRSPVDEDGKPQLPVRQSSDKIFHLELIRGIHSSFLRAGVLFEAVPKEKLFPRAQPRRTLGRVWEDEEDDDASQNSDDAFENEDPAKCQEEHLHIESWGGKKNGLC